MDGILILLVGGVVYFAPAINAALRGHRAQGSIVVVNLFLGWTLLGWVVALAWSYGPNVEPKRGAAPMPAEKPLTEQTPPPQIEQQAPPRSRPAPDAQTLINCPGCAEPLAWHIRRCPSCGHDMLR